MVTSWLTPRETEVGGAPCLLLSWQVGRCDLAVYILKNEPRVLIGQGDFPPREADAVEVEALAERFNSDELQAALLRMQDVTNKPWWRFW